MLPLYDDAKARHEERLHEAELERLIKEARANRANVFQEALDALRAGVASRIQRMRAERQRAGAELRQTLKEH